jgi:DNA-binding Xre family transcriptional regulator
MTTVHFKVGDTLRRHNKTPAALIEASGLAKTTVYNIVNNKAKAVELETLGKLIAGLRELTQEDVGINDIIKEATQPDWREEIFRNAKPLDWDAMMATIPDWTEEEQRENDAFIEFLESERKKNRGQPSKRIQQMLEILSDDADAV